ncbi:MAG: hypothetical protein KC713_09770 [Candidatus Omnitrophica bacterium]|nr:hypothetical protein [Candidatus Omnitrophota bacterium]
MPCSDSSSSLCILLDHDEKFISFEYAKITCGREITADTGYNAFCQGKDLTTILNESLEEVCQKLDCRDEEGQFILYLEWEVLRSAIAQYLGLEHPSIDKDRCRITSIEHTENGVEISQVVLPPKEMPKILPCNLADQKE